MPRGRVAVLCIHPLFGRGIARLLQADEELEVTCLTAGLADMPEKLKRFRPHAIVVEESADARFWRDVFPSLPPALLIGIRPQENVMDVYRKWQVAGARPEDLLHTIRTCLGTASQPTTPTA